MVDLGPLFALGQSLARQAIDTGGTTIAIQHVTTATDPDTLEEVETVTQVGDLLPALVVPVGGTTQQVLPGVELRSTDWKVVLHPDVTEPPEGHRVLVTASRDVRLPGRHARVLGTVSSSAGAVLTVFARP